MATKVRSAHDLIVRVPQADRSQFVVVSLLGLRLCHAWRPWSKTIDKLETLRRLVLAGDIRVSEHGYDELSADGILVRDVLDGIAGTVLVEDYPSFGKGPAVLVLQRDRNGEPLHIVWGLPKGHLRPAVVVTGYRPDPERWLNDFRERKK